jgi:hypothetical protein
MVAPSSVSGDCEQSGYLDSTGPMSSIRHPDRVIPRLGGSPPATEVIPA